MHLVRVIAPKVRVAEPGDILMTPFANHSTFFPISVTLDTAITMPTAFRNVSTFPTKRITTGDEPNITVPLITNTSTFPGFEISEASPDEFIRMSGAFVNESTFPEFEIAEAPADGIIRMAAPIANATSFPDHVATLSSDGGGGGGVDDDENEGIATGTIGGMI